MDPSSTGTPNNRAIIRGVNQVSFSNRLPPEPMTVKSGQDGKDSSLNNRLVMMVLKQNSSLGPYFDS
jgi:hypothetical protein